MIVILYILTAYLLLINSKNIVRINNNKNIVNQEVNEMNVTVYRHEAYNKFIVTIETGFNVQEFTLYDMTISELGEFIRAITKEEN